MGTYVNPGNESFRIAVDSDIYIDKTGLLEVLNRSIGTEQRFFAVSRARRFGKSQAAGMLDAYYSRGCDSGELFSKFEIAKAPDFETHLNQYNVLHFDASTFFNAAKSPEDVVPMMDRKLLQGMIGEFPYLAETMPENTADAINQVFEREGRLFVIIIDEWECIIRDAKDDEKLILDYLRYLRGFFKTEEAKKFLALGYITGILPVKKIEGESALNNFREYTMISPKNLAPFFGFTEREVEKLCQERHMDIDAVRQWYDGYLMKWRDTAADEKRELHMYNPNSIVECMLDGVTDSYWKNTGAFRGLNVTVQSWTEQSRPGRSASRIPARPGLQPLHFRTRLAAGASRVTEQLRLNTFIERNEAGLKDTVVRMLAGERCPVKTGSYQNDLTQFKKKDDVLTALIHMGYLGYDTDTGEAFIPNEEVRDVFESAVAVGDWPDVQDALDHSDELLAATWDGDAKKVAEAVARSQQDYASIIQLHDENALACAVMMSYFTARKHYYVKRELPSGRGFADIAFIPRKEGAHPAMIVELKWNRSAKAAIKQIRDKEYAGVLSDCRGEMLLVGINYNKKSGRYTCKIERTSRD